MQPIFHLLTLGVCVGGNANFRVCVGSARLLKDQHVGIPTQNLRWICVVVEYRLDFNSASHMNYKISIVCILTTKENGHF